MGLTIRAIITCCLFVLFTGTLFAQKEIVEKSAWVKAYENASVLINKKTIEVSDKKNDINAEYIQFEYINKTDKQLFVKWYFDATYTNSVPQPKTDDENYRALLLDPNQTFKPSILVQKDKMFLVFKRLLGINNTSILKSLDFYNLEAKSL